MMRRLMNRHVWWIGLLLVGACQDANTPTAAVDSEATLDLPPQSSAGSAPGSIVVLSPRANARVVARDHGITPRYTYSFALRGFAGRISEAARAGLLKDGRVVSIEKDRVFAAQGTEPAPSWGLDRIDQRRKTDGLYTYAATGRGVSAYIVDTGIRYTHHDFGGRASFGFDAYGADGSDCHGHGTHVAGIVGGSKYGVAKDVDLVSVRVLDCAGSGTTSAVLAGLDWVLANARRPAVVNMSMSGDPDALIDGAIRRLHDGGVSVVVAAGNNGADACAYSPGRAPEALTIAATTWNDSRPMYSNYGDCVDWFAPGNTITSDAIATDTSTAVRSGTSMAAPHTTGAVALYLERAPAASAEQVRTALASWTTKRIVGLANTANDDLLYTLGNATMVGGNAPPTAGFGVACTALDCAFQDSSSDADGSVVGWTWDFGDGSTSVERSPAHTYAASGDYVASLVVVDDAGAADSATQTVSVAASSPANAPPTAAFDFACTRLSCDFVDASADPDGSVMRLEWNFGDGQPAVVAASAQQTHTFTAGAAYSVTLTVTDDDGASGTLVRSVPAGVVLSLNGGKQKGRHVVDLSWVGVASSTVDVYLGDAKLATVSAAGGYTYSEGGRGQGTYAFRVCEAGTGYCSRTETIAF